MENKTLKNAFEFKDGVFPESSRGNRHFEQGCVARNLGGKRKRRSTE
jgi:hypothetical protein